MRAEVNRFAEMEAFVLAVDSKGFSAAARALSLTPSAVSKTIARLEARLGCRLLSRSTRGIQITAEGQAFYERCNAILADVRNAERDAARAKVPQGRVRVNSNLPFGTRHLLPLLPAFLARYPKVQVDLVLTDSVVDLVEDRTDVAIRTGRLKASSLRGRTLGESELVVVASPGYLERHGRPTDLDDLVQHNCLAFNIARHVDTWTFRVGREQRAFVPRGNASVSDGESMHRLALAGLGLARLARFQVEADLDSGALVTVLDAYAPGERQPVHALFVGPGRLMSPRVRVFIDFLVEHIQLR